MGGVRVLGAEIYPPTTSMQGGAVDNYNDVCAQLVAAGLLEPAPVVDGRLHRVRVLPPPTNGGDSRPVWWVDSGAEVCY